MAAELILGTAQLGSAYGINNKEGRLSKKAALSVLDVAYENGIRILDTAERYGDSEKIIGKYIRETGNVFRVCTKLSEITDAYSVSDVEFIRSRLGRSLEKLNIDSAFIFYLHDYEMCQSIDLLYALQQLKQEGLVEQIGVSIYEPHELRCIIDELADYIDVVQIPLNVFNCSQWLHGGLLRCATASGIKLAARSVYLQGLVFMDEADVFVKKLGLEEAIRDFRRIAREQGVSYDSLACSFIQNIAEISWIILGSETPNQVMRNIELFSDSGPWTTELIERQISVSGGIAAESVDPRQWNRLQ